MKIYLDLILNDRYWSWSLIGAIYLMIAMLLRQLILRGLVRQTKQVDPNVYSAVKALYLKKSVPGWIVFLLSFLLVVGVWLGWAGPLGELRALFLLICFVPIAFIVSVILHLLSYSKALLSVLSQRIGVEKEF